MKYFLALTVFIVACSSKNQDKKTIGLLPTEERTQLVEVASFTGAQVTGVTTTWGGRMFANFPRWRENVAYSVVEVFPDGSIKPYPNETWNKWKGHPEKNTFTCVQSVVAFENSLFVLDPASPKMEGIVGRPMLYEFDLTTNELKNSWVFDKNIAPKKSYLNDLRIDKENGKVYITDSGLGGIVVLDMASGEARRVLDNHASTKAENVTLLVNGQAFTMRGAAPRIHSDGIEYNPMTKRLYYHALTGYHLYSIPTEALVDATKNASESVQDMGVTPAPDGMAIDSRGNIYMADLERNAITYRTPGGDMRILIQDERINWPDSLSIDRDNNLVFTDSLLQRAPAGVSADGLIFKIYKVRLPTQVGI